MIYNIIIQTLVFLLGVSSIWFIGRKEKWSRWGYVFGILAQPLWVYISIIEEQWGILVLSVFYFYSWGQGIYNYWIKKENKNITLTKNPNCENYLFLDIDGVIATPDTLNGGMWGLTPEKQDLLAIILEKTDAKIVLSSSWRKHTLEDTIKYMDKEGFRFSDKIIGITIRAYHYIEKGVHLSIPRGVEIKQWLDTHATYPWYAYPERKEEFKIYNEKGEFKIMKSQILGVDYNYVILDDDTDMLLEHKDHYVNCNSEEGLTMKNVNKAIEILLLKKTNKI